MDKVYKELISKIKKYEKKLELAEKKIERAYEERDEAKAVLAELTKFKKNYDESIEKAKVHLQKYSTYMSAEEGTNSEESSAEEGNDTAVNEHYEEHFQEHY